MAIAIDPVPGTAIRPAERAPHPRVFWSAPLLSAAVITAFFVQVFVANILVTPWYLPLGGTISAVIAIWAIGRPLRWWRVAIAAGCVAIACLEWAFVAMSVLPAYGGAVAEGATLPAFHARFANGAEVDETFFQQGQPTALVFFQGRWCPFCMTQLRELEAHHEVLANAGGRAVVVSIEDVATAQLSQRDFPHLVVLSDEQRELSNAVDVINRGFGPDGQDSAAPTILVLDGEGKVKWVHRPTRFIARPSARQLAQEIGRK